VEVTLLGDNATDEWRRLEVLDRANGDCFPGWWRQFSAFLLTVAATCEYPPPTALDTPPALAGGAPTHSWMAAPLAETNAFSRT
jgi:hypothetical protein